MSAKDLAADSAMEAGKDKVKELGMTLLRGKEEDKPKRAYVGAAVAEALQARSSFNPQITPLFNPRNPLPRDADCDSNG